MADYIALTNKGPIILRKDVLGRWQAMFAGAEYTLFSLRKGKINRKEQNEEKQIAAVVEASVNMIQRKRFGKIAEGKKDAVKVVSISQREATQKLEVQTEKEGLTGLFIMKISQILEQIMFTKIKQAPHEEYVEGLFTSPVSNTEKEGIIEAFIVFEVLEIEKVFSKEYSIILQNEEKKDINKRNEENERSDERKASTSIDEENKIAAEILNEFEHWFYAGELKFVLSLVAGRECIQEIGKKMYNSEYMEIFEYLLSVIEMYITVFTEIFLVTLDIEEIHGSIKAYIGNRDNTYTNSIGSVGEKKEALNELIEQVRKLEKEKGIEYVLRNVNVPFIKYIESVRQILYSKDFIRYIKGIEEKISIYKKAYSPLIAQAENTFDCNVCFLFVDIYHRIIKYKMYLEEANKHLRVAEEKKKIEKKCIKYMERIDKEWRLLSDLLVAAERYKKEKEVRKGIQVPDMIGNFVEVFTLDNGSVIVTEEKIVLIVKNSVVCVLDKDEIIGCMPESRDDCYSLDYIDILSFSLYPPGSYFVVDYVGGVRAHWTRMKFKWSNHRDRFISAFACREIVHIPGFDVMKKDKKIDGRETEVFSIMQRKKPEIKEIKASYKRMLGILEARKLVSMHDLYIYGKKRRISEKRLFRIKDWTDKTIEEYMKNESNVFMDKFAIEIVKVAEKYPPVEIVPYIINRNEFTILNNDGFSVEKIASVFVEYLSYVLRSMCPGDLEIYSSSAVNSLISVKGIESIEMKNDEFLTLVLEYKDEILIPNSINKNEFLLSLIIIRILLIAKKKIGKSALMSVCAPLFIFHLHDFIPLLD